MESPCIDSMNGFEMAVGSLVPHGVERVSAEIESCGARNSTVGMETRVVQMQQES